MLLVAALFVQSYSQLTDVQQDYDYLVFAEGSNYVGMASNGSRLYVDTNASYVANACTGNGGVTKITADLTLDTPIIVWNSSKLVLDCTLTLTDGANCSLIQNEDQTSGNWNIEVNGGVLDGNKANQDNNANDHLQTGINFVNVTNFRVDGVEVYGAEWNGIFVHESRNGTVINSNIHDNGEHGVIVWNCYFVTVENNRCWVNSRAGINVHAGVVCVVLGNICWDNDQEANNNYNLAIHTGSDGTEADGNSVYYTVAHHSAGFWIYNSANVKIVGGSALNCSYGYALFTTTGCSVVGALARHCTQNIIVYNGSDNLISGTTLLNSDDRGILIQAPNGGSCYNNVVSGCTFKSCSKAVSELQSGSGVTDRNIIIGCDAYTNTNGFLTLGANTQVNHSWNLTTWIG